MQLFRHFVVLAFVLCCTVHAQQGKNIVKLAQDTDILSTLVTVLTNKNYKSVLTLLSGDGPFTVFAPTDDAFAAANIDIKDVEAVKNVLAYHVLQSKVVSSDLKNKQSVKTVQGATILVTKNNKGVMVNGEATVVLADVMATNGVVHVIDKVLTPPATPKNEMANKQKSKNQMANKKKSSKKRKSSKKKKSRRRKGSKKSRRRRRKGRKAKKVKASSIVELALATPALSTLASVLSMPDYAPILKILSGKGPFTVFAPTDAAFTAANVDVTDVQTVSAVLTYHVLAMAVTASDLKKTQNVETAQGEKVLVTKDANGVMINGRATVVQADVMASNGVVHVIDALLLPPSLRGKTIVELAQDTKRLSTLVSILTMPEYKTVLDLLSSTGPFTVFAPTDDAFAAAGVDLNDVETVTSVLAYHVLAGAVKAGDLKQKQSPATVQGEMMTIKKRGGTVSVNGGATVVIADIIASNGVVHVIDTLLIPPSF